MGAADRACFGEGLRFGSGWPTEVDVDVQVEVLGEEVLEFTLDDPEPVVACGEGLGSAPTHAVVTMSA